MSDVDKWHSTYKEHTSPRQLAQEHSDIAQGREEEDLRNHKDDNKNDEYDGAGERSAMLSVAHVLDPEICLSEIESKETRRPHTGESLEQELETNRPRVGNTLCAGLSPEPSRSMFDHVSLQEPHRDRPVVDALSARTLNRISPSMEAAGWSYPVAAMDVIPKSEHQKTKPLALETLMNTPPTAMRGSSGCSWNSLLKEGRAGSLHHSQSPPSYGACPDPWLPYPELTSKERYQSVSMHLLGEDSLCSSISSSAGRSYIPIKSGIDPENTITGRDSNRDLFLPWNYTGSNERSHYNEGKDMFYFPASTSGAEYNFEANSYSVAASTATHALSANHPSIEDQEQRPELQCEYCCASFTGRYRKGNYRRHVQYMHGISGSDGNHMCDICGRTFNRPDAKLKHLRQRHQPLEPSIQNYEEAERFNIRVAALGPSSHPCKEAGCFKSFEHRADLLRHQRTHIKGLDRPYHCTKCSLTFLYPKDLQRHEATHAGTNRFILHCKVQDCTFGPGGQGFSRHDNLQRHMKRCHPEVTGAASRR